MKVVSSSVVCRVDRNDFSAIIVNNEDGTWKLTWNDHVANEWSETYNALAHALMRLALLITSTSLDALFRETDPVVFAEHASDFLLSELEALP